MHIQPENKTVLELEDLLIDIYKSHYSEIGITFIKMVEKFANDDFYNLHLIAKEYMSVDPVFRIENVNK